jgi:tRNA 2-thiouridine synthesizing protein A
MNIDKEIDTRGLNCPLPILRAKKALTDMASGQLLKVVATDPGSVRDFQAFARQTGNELVEQETVGEEFVHVFNALHPGCGAGCLRSRPVRTGRS